MQPPSPTRSGIRPPRGRAIIPAICGVFLVVLGVTPVAAAPPRDANSPILRPVGIEIGPGRHVRAEVLRHRAMLIDLDQLATLKADGNAHFTLDLFDDVRLEGRLLSKGRPGRSMGHAETYSLSGDLVGTAGGTFTLVVHRDVVAGILTIPGAATYQIHHVGRGMHEICELDLSAYPGCGTGDEHLVYGDGGLQASSFPLAGADDAGGGDVPTIDVLILYTTAARELWGGVANVEAETLLAATVTNDAFERSLIDVRINVLPLLEVAYPETGSSSNDLIQLTFASGGDLSQVPAIRDTSGADNVSLFVSTLDACGSAWVMRENSLDFEDRSFSVCRIDCAAANWTYAHEIGHNLGCTHQRVSGSTGVFDFSHGYLDEDNTFRTILDTSRVGAPRVGHFSNPNVSYQSRPTGVTANRPNAADNALTINLTWVTMAQFRGPSGCPLGPTLFDCNRNCIDDAFEIAASSEADCNLNGVPDSCDIASPEISDCNRNDIPDSCEIDSSELFDCNLNGIPDSCDIASPEFFDCNQNAILDNCEDDCNGNGLADECELESGGETVTIQVHEISPVFSPFGISLTPPEYVIVAPPIPQGDVTITFFAIGPLFPSRNAVDIWLNGQQIDRLFLDGTDCPSTPDTESLTMSSEVFLSLTGGGDAVIGMSTFDFLEEHCDGQNSIAVEISYLGSTVTGPSPDENNNDQLDECELARGDSDLDGVVDIDDFLAVLTTWGICPALCPTDADGDGIVGITDFLNVLANWG